MRRLVEYGADVNATNAGTSPYDDHISPVLRYDSRPETAGPRYNSHVPVPLVGWI